MRFERITVAAERDDGVVVLPIERLEPLEDVRRLPECQAEVRPVERNVAEPDERPARLLLSGDPRRIGLNPGKRDSPLDAPLHFDERELQVDRRRQFGLFSFELLEFGDFAGIGPLGTARTFGHVRIVPSPSGRRARSSTGSPDAQASG